MYMAYVRLPIFIAKDLQISIVPKLFDSASNDTKSATIKEVKGNCNFKRLEWIKPDRM